jgi:hypothetical protein
MDRNLESRSGAHGARGWAVLLACVGVALMLGVAALSAATAPSFAPARNYGTGVLPISIAVGDLNGDGKPDLATANPATDNSTDTASVLLNRGDGSFGTKRNYRTRPFPLSIAIGDLNGDGKGDLVTANLGPDTVSVLLNRGDGSFQPRRDYATGEDPMSVAIGDLNGDGKGDLVTANLGPDTVSVLLNRGDGSFHAKRDYGAGGGSVAIGDLNGDGQPDLATPNSVLVNRGDGSFKARRDDAPGGFWVGIADVNGDGKPDLVGASMTIVHADTLTVSVLVNRGGGSFQTRRNYRAGRYPNSASYGPSSVALGDLNGDGKPELAIACCDKPVVSVLTNRGDGRFGPKLEYRTGQPTHIPETSPPTFLSPDRASSVTIGDLNGDGKLDLAVANYLSSTVSVLIDAPGLCTVQDVNGMTLPAAKGMIARANCRVGKIRRAYSKTVKRGRVISEKPKPGTVLPNRGRVNVVVSRGRKH